MNIVFEYPGPISSLERRELLGRPLADQHKDILGQFPNRRGGGGAFWRVRLGNNLLFDYAGLRLIDQAITQYAGPATGLTFKLKLDGWLRRDYYSLQSSRNSAEDGVELPITAHREGTPGKECETLEINLPVSFDSMNLPMSLGGSLPISVPEALLLPYKNEFDMLFANQIAILSDLRRRVRRSPRAWFKGLTLFLKRGPFRDRAALAYRRIGTKANVHPTAVIEGSVISDGAQIGANCVVRYSLIGPEARLHDGAKVEFSVVGARSWLMHDLVLFRSCAEEDVFLIHGPYQFSLFHRQSSAFATILMDYRPDGKPISVKTTEGLRPYAGRFLGAVLGEGAKVLGGSSLAPGRIVPPHTWLAADPAGVHTVEEDDLPRQVPLAPQAQKRRPDEQLVRG